MGSSRLPYQVGDVLADGRRGSGVVFTNEGDWFLVNRGGGPVTGRRPPAASPHNRESTRPSSTSRPDGPGRTVTGVTPIRPQGKEFD